MELILNKCDTNIDTGAKDNDGNDAFIYGKESDSSAEMVALLEYIKLRKANYEVKFYEDNCFQLVCFGEFKVEDLISSIVFPNENEEVSLKIFHIILAKTQNTKDEYSLDDTNPQHLLYTKNAEGLSVFSANYLKNFILNNLQYYY